MDTLSRRKNEGSGTALVRSPRDRSSSLQDKENAAEKLKPIARNGTFAIYLGGEPENVDLKIGKVYRVLKPLRGDNAHDLRVIDESKDDYIYPAAWFAPVELPPRARRVLVAME